MRVKVEYNSFFLEEVNDTISKSLADEIDLHSNDLATKIINFAMQDNMISFLVQCYIETEFNTNDATQLSISESCKVMTYILKIIDKSGRNNLELKLIEKNKNG